MAGREEGGGDRERERERERESLRSPGGPAICVCVQYVFACNTVSPPTQYVCLLLRSPKRLVFWKWGGKTGVFDVKGGTPCAVHVWISVKCLQNLCRVESIEYKWAQYK
jgi:hypothetical protein